MNSSGKTVFFFLLPSGVHHRHLLRSDLVRQALEIQQHHEGPASEQQHGGEDLDPRHFLSQFQEGRRSLDHHAQPYASDLERRTDTLHAQVDVTDQIHICLQPHVPLITPILFSLNMIVLFFCGCDSKDSTSSAWNPSEATINAGRSNLGYN